MEMPYNHEPDRNFSHTLQLFMSVASATHSF